MIPPKSQQEGESIAYKTSLLTKEVILGRVSHWPGMLQQPPMYLEFMVNE
jgi:hypothetical protein